MATEIVGKPIKTTRRYKGLLDDHGIDAIIVAVPDQCWDPVGLMIKSAC